ncbi:NUDIX hydrolase [Roseovarius sp. EL26]|uniref:NUDIX hydrolase n=1 Tax=Roseovarius sp. EL26 TaxID=2126672 RepID=UPI000EA0338B|nr:NUDIX domain-containing protein [Roseovarius sp. EL26]
MRERPAARILVLNAENKILLFRFCFDDGPLAGENYWATPGGGVEKGETFRNAAQRELFEETGFTIDVGEEIGQHDTIFRVPSGEYVKADERYFFVRVTANTICKDGQSDVERTYLKEHRWWSLTELESTSHTIFPENLIPLVTQSLS